MKLKVNKKAWSNFVSQPGLVLPSLVLGLLVSAGLIIGISIFSNTQLVLAREEITVKGVAYKDVVADQGTWEITISVVRDTRAESLATMETQQKIVSDYLSKFGSFTTKLGIPRTLEKYEYEGSKQTFSGYVSTITFTITSNNVDELYREATNFNKFAVEKNLDLKVNSTSFYYSELDSLKIDLLKKAVADAKERAKALGSTSNTRVGRVKRASQGVFQVNERNNYDVSAGGNFNTESKDKTIQATVDITFELL